MAEGSFCCFGTRDSAIPRTSSDQVHVLQDMFKVDYEREREGNEDFVTKCNKAFLLSTCMPNVGALWMYGECVQWLFLSMAWCPSNNIKATPCMGIFMEARLWNWASLLLLASKEEKEYLNCVAIVRSWPSIVFKLVSTLPSTKCACSRNLKAMWQLVINPVAKIVGRQLQVQDAPISFFRKLPKDELFFL